MYDRIAGLTRYGREAVKPRFLAVIYGRPEHMHTLVGTALRDLYPGVFDAVAGLNRRLGHGELPRRLQRLESGVMIGRVAARLVREHQSVPLLTVHDSILVPAESVGLARAVVAEEWEAEFGVVPATKVSTFTAPHDPRPKPGRTARRPRGRVGAGADLPDVAATA